MNPASADAGARMRLLVAVGIAAALTPLNSTMVAVALPALAGEFHTAAASVTVSVVTSYLVATIVCQMPAGSVADRLGYARALTIGRWIFAAGATAAVLAPVLPVVVVGRLLMAAGGALMVPTAMALLRVAVRPERRARAFGTMGAVMGGAAAIGPGIGGIVLQQVGWRALFLVNVPLLALSWLLQGRSPAPAGERAPVAPARPALAFDWAGTALLGAAMPLLVVASRTRVPLAWVLAAAGLALLVALVAHERRAIAPILDLSLFRLGGFVAGAGVIALQNLAMYSLLVLVPFLFGTAPGADAAGLSLAIVAMTATMAVVSPLGGMLAEHVSARWVVAAGGLLGTAAVASLATLPVSAPPLAVGARLLVVGLALGLSTGPAQAGAIGAVEVHRTAMASAAVAMLRYVGGIIGTVILGYAMSGHGAERTAMAVYTGAFLLSALAGACLPAGGDSEGGAHLSRA